VPLPPDEAWKVLMDIARIAPCMPGAALTQVVDDRTYKGTVAVKLGPVALSLRRSTRHRIRRASRRKAATPRDAAAPTPPSIFICCRRLPARRCGSAPTSLCRDRSRNMAAPRA
jgi:hypothetical protein